MEDFGARDRDADAFCRARVAECDVFVLLLGHQYGSAPDGGLSYTEREHEAAVAAGLPRLIFLQEDREPAGSPAEPAEPDAQRDKQQRFRERLRQERIVAFFREPDALATQVVAALRNLEHERRLAPPPGTPRRKRLVPGLAVAGGLAVLIPGLFFARDLILRGGTTVSCPDGPHHTIDLREFQTQYSAYSVSLEANVAGHTALSGRLDPVQLTQISEASQQAAELRKSLVASYNACIITAKEFAAISARYQTLDSLARQIDQLTRQPTLNPTEQAALTTLVDQYVRSAQQLSGP